MSLRAKFISLLFVPALLSACASYDLRVLSTLEPLGEGKFKWRTIGDVVYPPDSERAEAQRIEQLANTMSVNCKTGKFAVLDRSVAQKTGSKSGKGTFDIFYTVQCQS